MTKKKKSNVAIESNPTMKSEIALYFTTISITFYYNAYFLIMFQNKVYECYYIFKYFL